MKQAFAQNVSVIGVPFGRALSFILCLVLGGVGGVLNSIIIILSKMICLLRLSLSTRL